MSTFLELYEPLDIIGNGSFGIIRKVRRKSDGLVFARKELNFERMSDRDRKQIVAEVNILKDLDHEHIVRYHDRCVDREAGILYIIMEYCGGGDLSSIIKQAQKHNRIVPEDTIWNYFMQILLALQHCHHPPNHSPDLDGKERRPQILHRDLKPDNVFLDENNSVKLGDFGLSKAIPQASFANTYVGTPYYMSPELMQEKAYDSKSDIWSLGCLIYELCALKPPFHEAKTHAELSTFIRNGRIPPLPRGYSHTLSNVIKAMLNLNPAMRPSAAQLLQHERLVLVTKVVEAEKMLLKVKMHKSAVVAKERDVSAREVMLADREAKLNSLVAEKDAEILRLHNTISMAQSELDTRIRGAVGKREEELRAAVRKREGEVAAAMARREEEILSAVRQREQEIFDAWRTREEQINADAEAMIAEKMRWVAAKEADLEMERNRLDEMQKDLETKLATLSSQEGKGRKEKTPLEEVKNLLAPLAQMTEQEHPREKRTNNNNSNAATPANRNVARHPPDYMPSAMKGVILTQTGQPLATPTPAELANLFVNSPKVGLDFAKIFDFESETEDDDTETEEVMPPSPTIRERPLSELSSHSSGSMGDSTSGMPPSAAPTRLRKPSIRGSAQRSSVRRASALPTSASDPTGLCSSSGVRASKSAKAKSRGEATASLTKPSVPFGPAEYDLSDEENLPSPFLRRGERERAALPSSVMLKPKRQSGVNMLRAVAAANSAGVKLGATTSKALGPKMSLPSLGGARPSLTNGRKTEEARKVLSRS